MTRAAREGAVRHAFVEYIPRELDERVLYISIPCSTAVHKCFCGCGQKVVTPLSPAQWQLIFDGETVSLEPSIGNWSFRCESHYWITNGHVKVAAHLTRDRIAAVRVANHGALQESVAHQVTKAALPQVSRSKSLWNRVKSWFQQD